MSEDSKNDEADNKQNPKREEPENRNIEESLRTKSTPWIQTSSFGDTVVKIIVALIGALAVILPAVLVTNNNSNSLITACTLQPCRNNGDCYLDVFGDYGCICPPNFTGTDVWSRAH